MGALDDANAYLLLGAFLILIGILSSLVANRFGAPLLLVFLVIGMAAGEDGPGGIHFDDYRVAYLVGSLALAVILFDGGLRTKLRELRGVLRPSIILSTLGVLVTAGLTGIFAWFVLDLSLAEGLLIGAVVSSTDAAAVFFLLRGGGLRLKRRVGATLEVESGANDPAALLLTVVLVEWLVGQHGGSAWVVLGTMVSHIGIGAIVGAVGGIAIAWSLNRLPLPSGLHPIFVMASAILVYALAAASHGSGFIAAYLAGLIVGGRPVRAAASVNAFHDAATWFFQIGMFLLLGLLVTPSRMVDFTVPALLVAAFLMLVARPVAVWLSLWRSRFTAREKAFIAWVGLRGAIGIFLASIPVLARVPNAELYFNIAFYVVLLSLLVQGWTVKATARRLGLSETGGSREARRVELDLPGQLEQELVGYLVEEGSPILAGAAAPPWAKLMLVVRDEHIRDPAEAGVLRAGDHAYYLAPPHRAMRLDRLFLAPGEAKEETYEFILPGAAEFAPVAATYGLPANGEGATGTLADIVADRLGDAPEPGDSVTIGPVEFVVREVKDGRASRIGLRVEEAAVESLGWTLLGPRIHAHFRSIGHRRANRKA